MKSLPAAGGSDAAVLDPLPPYFKQTRISLQRFALLYLHMPISRLNKSILRNKRRAPYPISYTTINTEKAVKKRALPRLRLRLISFASFLPVKFMPFPPWPSLDRSRSLLHPIRQAKGKSCCSFAYTPVTNVGSKEQIKLFQPRSACSVSPRQNGLLSSSIAAQSSRQSRQTSR